LQAYFLLASLLWVFERPRQWVQSTTSSASFVLGKIVVTGPVTNLVKNHCESWCIPRLEKDEPVLQVDESVTCFNRCDLVKGISWQPINETKSYFVSMRPRWSQNLLTKYPLFLPRWTYKEAIERRSPPKY
jgi:hypothetical protein